MKKLALLIPSFARVPDVVRQINSMAYAQTYHNTHLFVSIKGVVEPTYNAVIMPQVKPLIDAGRLTIRMSGNTNQMWNFLDTIEGQDIDGYDLFLKIDDDDYYHPEYLQGVVDALDMSPPQTSTYVRGNYKICSPQHGTWQVKPWFDKGKEFRGWGDLLGMSRIVIDHLRTVQKDVDLLLKDTEGILEWKHAESIGWREDRYYFECMKRLGPCVDITKVFCTKGIAPVVIGGHTQEGSFTRNKLYRNSEFFEKVTDIKRTKGNPPRAYVIELQDGTICKLFDGKMIKLDNGYAYRYTKFENGELELTDGTKYKQLPNGQYAEERPDSGGDQHEGSGS